MHSSSCQVIHTAGCAVWLLGHLFHRSVCTGKCNTEKCLCIRSTKGAQAAHECDDATHGSLEHNLLLFWLCMHGCRCRAWAIRSRSLPRPSPLLLPRYPRLPLLMHHPKPPSRASATPAPHYSPPAPPPSPLGAPGSSTRAGAVAGLMGCVCGLLILLVMLSGLILCNTCRAAGTIPRLAGY
jgi:hypothetical protein